MLHQLRYLVVEEPYVTESPFKNASDYHFWLATIGKINFYGHPQDFKEFLYIMLCTFSG